MQKFFNNEEQGLKEFVREIELMSKLQHPNILSLLGIFVDEKYRYLVTELMELGSVYDIIHTKEVNPKNQVGSEPWI